MMFFCIIYRKWTIQREIPLFICKSWKLIGLQENISLSLIGLVVRLIFIHERTSRVYFSGLFQYREAIWHRRRAGVCYRDETCYRSQMGEISENILLNLATLVTKHWIEKLMAKRKKGTEDLNFFFELINFCFSLKFPYILGGFDEIHCFFWTDVYFMFPSLPSLFYFLSNAMCIV